MIGGEMIYLLGGYGFCIIGSDIYKGPTLYWRNSIEL